jgi:hypothetical protein
MRYFKFFNGSLIAGLISEFCQLRMLAVSGEQCGLSGDMVLTYSLHQIEHTNYDDRNPGSFLETSVSTNRRFSCLPGGRRKRVASRKRAASRQRTTQKLQQRVATFQPILQNEDY